MHHRSGFIYLKQAEYDLVMNGCVFLRVSGQFQFIAIDPCELDILSCPHTHLHIVYILVFCNFVISFLDKCVIYRESMNWIVSRLSPAQVVVTLKIGLEESWGDPDCSPSVRWSHILSPAAPRLTSDFCVRPLAAPVILPRTGSKCQGSRGQLSNRVSNSRWHVNCQR